MEKLADKLTNLLLRNHVIVEQDKDIYIYGFQITIANFINAALALLLGLITFSLEKVIIFYFVFMLTRQFNGGYHSATYGRCFVSFAGCIILMILMSSILDFIGNPWWVMITTYILYGVAVWKISPCPNEKVSLSDSEKKRYRKMSWGILLAAGCVNALLAGFHIDTYSCVITTTIWEVTFLMWLGRRAYERREKNASGEGGC